jgi:predicted transposase YbfD/YdcC
MKKFIKTLESIQDNREQHKVKHKLCDIIFIVLCAKLANADDWQVHQFAEVQEPFLREYIELPNGIPSHDTLQRNFAVISPNFLHKLQNLFNEALTKNQNASIGKILALDGKTERGNGNCNQKANHIVSAVDENGICYGQELVDAKSNEIKAIPLLLEKLNIKGQIITADAMGTQKEIADKIISKKANYVLALKSNQHNFYDDVKLYFEDNDLLKKCSYACKIEKAHNCLEKREYWQTDNISWLVQKKEWRGLKTIAMTRNTICKNEKTTTEIRYFISSLKLNAEEIARCIRGHWVAKSFHWHLDVTFREDSNKTLEKQAAFNLNIINKIALTILKYYNLGLKPMSLKKKRYRISLNSPKFLKNILD